MTHPLTGAFKGSSRPSGRKQVALWLRVEDWEAIERLASHQGLNRIRVLALMLKILGRTEIAEALDRLGRERRGYAKGWAKPLLAKAPRTRQGRVRMAIWLDKKMAMDVMKAIHDIKTANGGVLAFENIKNVHST